MKTKTLFLLCLLIGIGLTELSAQNKTVQLKVKDVEYHTHVFCDGVHTDFLQGTGNLHMVYHLKDGNWQWEIDQWKAEAVSVGFLDENGEKIGGTGEIFKASEIDFFCKPTYPYIVWHQRLKGDQGHVYVGFIYFNWDTGELFSGRSECH
jgi:hypothetical protein